MILIFLRGTLRNLLRYKLSSSINLIGLSTAIGCCIVIYLFLQFSFDMDSFHVNRDRIYLLESVVTKNGATEVWANSAAPLAFKIKETIPGVKYVTRIAKQRVAMRREDNLFQETVQFVDEPFLKMFTFPLEKGMNDIPNKQHVILSAEVATKYFGNENPVGKEVEIIFGSTQKSFFVGGVAKEFPDNASFTFNVLLSWDQLIDIYNVDDTSWKEMVMGTFVEFESKPDEDQLNKLIKPLVKLQNEINPDAGLENILFAPLSSLSQNHFKVKKSFTNGPHPAGKTILITIGIFLLILTSLNYTNIAISSSATRLKEIGIKKTLGASKRQIFTQFLFENFILSSLSMIIGIVLAYFFFLPQFNSFLPFSIPFRLSPGLIFFFFGLLFFISFISGGYPSYFLASFNPVSILSGNYKFNVKAKFTKITLMIQFVLSFIAISAGIAFVLNGKYQKELSWGYTPDNVWVLALPDSKAFSVIKDKCIENQNVIQVAGSKNHIGSSYESSVVEYNNEKYDVHLFNVGYNYLETLSMDILHGRSFNEKLSSDSTEAIIINEECVHLFDLKNPIGAQLRMEDHIYVVVGVVKNFHYNNFYVNVHPAVIKIAPESEQQYVVLKAKAGSEISPYLMGLWKEFITDAPYAGYSQSEVFSHFFYETSSHQKIMSFVSLLTLFISCVGLFGLLSLKIVQNMKYYSMQKILGASLFQIGVSIQKEFIWLLFFASLIAAPLSYAGIDRLLSELYKDHIAFGLQHLLLTLFLLFISILTTGSFHVYKVYHTNPTKGLKTQ